MKKLENITVGISIGDLNGIGGEIILKTFEDSRMLEFCTPVIFASIPVMTFLKNHCNSKVNFNGINNFNQVQQHKVNVFQVWKEPVKINFGKEDFKIGAYAIKSLQAATQALKQEQVQLLVTAPINKHSIQSDTFKFPGHTNYLQQELTGNSLMFMVANTLRVGLLTDHVPVNEIAKHITPSLIKQKVETIHQSLQQDFNIAKPKIAVLGINPHTGDNGVIGKEDDTIMRPTLQQIKNSGKYVFGPYAADSFFGSNNYKNFDAIIAAYHDQGLIPFKTLSFGKGVNYTAGLSQVRTSPDHGTAFEIAGKNQADNSSFKEAIFTGIQIYKNRIEYQLLSQNPLKTNQTKL